MDTTETYNGWKNYPTWNVNLWLSNEEPLYHAALELAGETLEDIAEDENVVNGIWTVEQASRYRVADALKTWVRDELPIAVDNGQGGTENVESLIGMHGDLLGYALDHVDWNEIADAWIESAKDQA